jgi:hypothetical protein
VVVSVMVLVNMRTIFITLTVLLRGSALLRCGLTS